MTDKLNIEVNIGDMIVYAKGARSDMDLYIGTVIGILDDGDFTIFTHDTELRIVRRPDQIINIQGLKDSNPEAFI